MKAVAVKGLTYKYWPGGPAVLNGLDFDLCRGEIVAVTGLSGCGKSTLCFCLSGLINNYKKGGVMTGEILVNGRNIRDLRAASLAREVGLVFQDPDTQLFSPTVEDEIAFAPENLCLPPEKIRERVDYLLDLLGIAALAEKNPDYLSGGEKRLVALAAVLALDPQILIMDEVMSPLDPDGRNKVASILEKLRAAGKSIIIAEHDLEAVALADRLVILDNGKSACFDRTEKVLADRNFLAAAGLIYNNED